MASAVIAFLVWYFLPALAWLRFAMRKKAAFSYMDCEVTERAARQIAREKKRSRL
jgi:hypothetical protein